MNASLPLLRSWLALALTAGALLVSAAAAAPVDGEPAAEPAVPIEIDAEKGIEWRREEKIVYARGNARAVRGDLVVTADELAARYRDLPDGGQEVWRLDATGNVKITTPGETAFGDSGIYNLDTRVLLLYGQPARLNSGKDVVTADDHLEYSPRTQVLIARGNASALQPNREVRADELTISLARRDDGGSGLQRIEAVRNVRVITPDEVMRGNQGTYDVTSGIATLNGDVRITRGENQLNGCRGEMNTKTGISRLLACGDGQSDRQRVHGVILPGASGGEGGNKRR